MRVLLTGATGFVGRALALRLLLEGHHVSALARNPARARALLPLPIAFHRWDAQREPVPAEALTGVAAVVNLAGEPIGPGWWSAARRRGIRESRVRGTLRLMEALAQAPQMRVVVSSSAIGFYGDRGDAELDEAAAPGHGFLAELCAEWERACLEAPLPASLEGSLRRVVLRIGMVLGRGDQGQPTGALAPLVPLFRAGLGGPLGSGRQWVSWIHLQDLVALISMALKEPAREEPAREELAPSRPTLRGIVNAVAPEPVPQTEFARTLGAALHRPALLPLPAFAAKPALGHFAEAVLYSQRVLPKAALAAGFRFSHPTLGPALAMLLDADEPHLERFQTALWLPRPVEDVFPFFSDPLHLQRLTPPWLDFRVLGTSPPPVRVGTLMDYRLRLYGVPIRWQSRIEGWEPPHGFVDTQTRGPYALWHHTHGFLPLQGGTLLTDDVRYRLRGGALGAIAAGWKVRRDVRRIFAYRRTAIEGWFAP